MISEGVAMAHPYHHALSSVKKWGGTVDDFIAVHTWFDQSKEITADFRHRALRHHAEGIFMAVTWTHKRKFHRASMRDRPTAATLHGIADRLQAIQRRNFYQLAAEVSHRGRYYHEYSMSVDVTRDSPTWQPPTEDAEEIVTEALRDLARWLYRQLEAEYDHLTSDEAVEDGIIANQYTFTAGGRRFG
jgi:hypothetical protein